MFFTSLTFASTSSKSPVIPTDINTIQINIPGRVMIYLNEEPGIRIQGDPEAKRFINCFIKDGILYIKPLPGTEEFLMDKSIVIYVSTNVEKVEVRSSRKYLIRRTKSGNHVKK